MTELLITGADVLGQGRRDLLIRDGRFADAPDMDGRETLIKERTERDTDRDDRDGDGTKEGECTYKRPGTRGNRCCTSCQRPLPLLSRL